LPRIKDLALDCFLSSRKNLNPSKRKNCFELLTFEFKVDEDFRTWLVDIQNNPILDHEKD
jgi:hypothetical protein